MTSAAIGSIMISVAFLTATGFIFATLLVIAEKKILSYGQCKISINKGEKKLIVAGGSSLLSSLMEQGIYIPSACGGRGSCAYCKVKVTEGGGVITPVEDPYLSLEERKNQIRLSCQVKIRSDISIEIPPELFSVKKYRGVVEHKKNLTHDIIELRISLIEPESISFIAGQYIQLESKEYEKFDKVMRAYSLSSQPSQTRNIELNIRLVPRGICTTYVFNHLKQGDEITFSGPYGHFRLSSTTAPIICIAGGSGMAPIWSILRDMQEKNIVRPVHYFFGAQTHADLFYLKEFETLSSHMPNIHFIPAVSNEPADSTWKGERGLITAVVEKYFPNVSGYEAYLCGSPGMIDACIRLLTKNGMEPEKIYYDKFA